MLELEYALIPHGLHVVGAAIEREAAIDTLMSVADAFHNLQPAREIIGALVDGVSPETAAPDAELAMRDALEKLAATGAALADDHEIPALLHALDGRYIRPAPGGDLLRTPEVLPTGRNLHGFDPFRIPSAFAVQDGALQAATADRRARRGRPRLPKTVAIVHVGDRQSEDQGGRSRRRWR